MKQIYAFRHSLKDGSANTIGPKGLALACKVGGWLYDEEGDLTIDKIFHGVLVRTAQTALAFFSRGGFEDSGEIMPAVEEFGNDKLFGEMVAPPQFRDIAKTTGNYRALLTCHDPVKVKEWAEYCAAGFRKMFDAMEDGEDAAAFSHSPSIELAVAGLTGTFEIPDEFATLKEMEGVLFEQDDQGIIKPVRKIAMPAENAAAQS